MTTNSSDIFTPSVAAFYDHYFRGVPGDVEYYTDEATENGGPILELACGSGRILLPIAAAGVEIVGIDVTPEMLARARRKLEGESFSDRARLIEGDMRTFDLGERFEQAIIAYNSFLHLLTPGDQARALDRVRAHLRLGGRLHLHAFDPRLDILATRAGVLERVPGFFNPTTGHPVCVVAAGNVDFENQIMAQDFILEEIGPGGAVAAKSYYTLTLRYLFRYETQYLLEAHGFEIEVLYGDYRRSPYRHGGEQVWVARKR